MRTSFIGWGGNSRSSSSDRHRKTSRESQGGPGRMSDSKDQLTSRLWKRYTPESIFKSRLRCLINVFVGKVRHLWDSVDHLLPGNATRAGPHGPGEEGR